MSVTTDATAAHRKNVLRTAIYIGGSQLVAAAIFSGLRPVVEQYGHRQWSRGLLGATICLVVQLLFDGVRFVGAMRVGIHPRAMFVWRYRGEYVLRRLVVTPVLGWWIFQELVAPAETDNLLSLIIGIAAIIFFRRRWARLGERHTILLLRRFGGAQLAAFGRHFIPIFFHLGRPITLTEAGFAPLRAQLWPLRSREATLGPIEHVSVDDANWQETALRHMADSMAIVCDVSDVTDAVRWEVESVVSRCPDKVVFVSARIPDARVERLLAGAPVLVYDDANHHVFQRSLGRALSNVILRAPATNTSSSDAS